MVGNWLKEKHAQGHSGCQTFSNKSGKKTKLSLLGPFWFLSALRLWRETPQNNKIYKADPECHKLMMTAVSVIKSQLGVGTFPTHTLVTALGGRIFMAEKELDFLFSWPPLLQMFIHHVFKWDRSFCRKMIESRKMLISWALICLQITKV